MLQTKKATRFLILLLCAAALLALPVAADAEGGSTVGDTMPPEYAAWLESLPDSVRALLPDGLFSTDSGEVGAAVQEMTGFPYLVQTVLRLVGARIGDCAKILATVCGLLILCAVCHALRAAFRSEGLSQAFGFCSTLVITLALFSQSYHSLESVRVYFENLNRMSAATLPISGVLYAMGGNTATAVSAATGLGVYMTVMETLVGKTVLPFCGICMAFALMGSVEPSLRSGTLLATVKKNYTTVLAFLMMLLLAMLAGQNLLGARSDSLAMRSVKFAAGNMIPMVGGSVAEVLRTIGAGVGYLRSTVGICGVLLVLLMLLPTLIELFLLRLTWQLAASAADLLGCDGERRLLEEFASLLGYLIAAVSICSSVLFLCFILLARCGSAVG